MSKSGFVSVAGIAVTLALATLGVAGRAEAADYLRGAYAGEAAPQAAGADWAGYYAGGHIGFSSGKTDPAAVGKAIGPQILPALAITDQIASLISLKDNRKQGVSYGAFVGINYLWDDVVLGVEGDYTHSSISASSTSGPTSRTLTAASTGTDAWFTTVSANSKSTLSDWGTIRGRAGYAFGNFLPYVTVGLALGNITSTTTGTGTTTQNAVTTDPVTGTPVYTPRAAALTNTAVIKHRGISYGAAFGAGVDMQLFPNTFLRAEWQYVQFASGGNRPEISINTARVAGGVKF